MVISNLALDDIDAGAEVGIFWYTWEFELAFGMGMNQRKNKNVVSYTACVSQVVWINRINAMWEV